MSKPKRGRKTLQNGRSANEQFTQLTYCMMRSDAFRSLQGSALKVFMELRTRYNGSNNGKLSLSYEEASRLLGIGKQTVGRAYDELLEKGLIKRLKKGQWMGRMAHEWALTDKSLHGHPPTNDWKIWIKPKQNAGSITRHLGPKNVSLWNCPT